MAASLSFLRKRRKTAPRIWSLKERWQERFCRNSEWPNELLEMTGRRPIAEEKQCPKWGKPIPLFNGKDLTGWKMAGPGTTCGRLKTATW